MNLSETNGKSQGQGERSVDFDSSEGQELSEGSTLAEEREGFHKTTEKQDLTTKHVVVPR